MNAEVKNFYSKEPTLINLYEVLDSEGRAVFGTENQNEAIAWFSRDMLNQDIVVTSWFAGDEDAYPAGKTIWITPIVLAAIATGRERGGR